MASDLSAFTDEQLAEELRRRKEQHFRTLGATEGWERATEEIEVDDITIEAGEWIWRDARVASGGPTAGPVGPTSARTRSLPMGRTSAGGRSGTTPTSPRRTSTWTSTTPTRCIR